MSSFRFDENSFWRIGRVAICTVVSLLAALSVMGSFAQGNLKPLLYSVIVAVALLLWFAFDKLFWPAAIATLFFGGRFSFLPAELSVFQIAMIFGAIRFVVDFIVFRKLKIEKGPVRDRIFMAGFFVILFAHAAHDRLALKALGSALWGGRPYITIGFALMTYFIIQTMPYDRKSWRMFPYLVLVPVTFDLGAQVVTLLAPGAAFRLGEYYTGFGVPSAQGMVAEDQRMGAWSGLGMLLTISILAFNRIDTLWRPEKWWALAVFLAGFVFNVLSGFRSAVVGWAMIVMTAGLRDFRRAVLVIVPLIAMALLALVLINDNVMPLPHTVQRGLTFLPGHWDADVAVDASASLNFRAAIRETWWNKYFLQHPLLGRGFGFDPIWANIDETSQGFDFYEAIIQVGNFHNLLIASLDAVGIVGTASLFLWCMLNLSRVLGVMLRVPVPEQPALLKWLGLYLVWLIVGNWMPLGGLSVSALVEPFLVLISLFIKVATEEGLLVNGRVVVPKKSRELEAASQPRPPIRALEPTRPIRGIRGHLPV